MLTRPQLLSKLIYVPENGVFIWRRNTTANLLRIYNLNQENQK